MGQPVPVALIGAGKVAHAAHLREMRDLPELLRPVAVIDPDPAHTAAVRAWFPGTRAGAGSCAADGAGGVTPAGTGSPVGGARPADGVAVCRTLDEAVRAGARAALVCTPWWTHRDVVLGCLERGLPVLCEKPVSLDLAEIDELAAAERRSGVPVAAGYMKRHDPVVARFLDHCREHLPAVRRITADIHDPNAPHQVEHLLPYPPPPFGPQPPPAEAALVRALGPGVTEAVAEATEATEATAVAARRREAYARGLGGSLIHQVNLVHAILAGGDLRLHGRLLDATGWAGTSAVSARWRPADGLLVDLTHVRLPGHRRYRETLECVAEDSVATLTLPSPYARDEAATLHVDTWDAGPGLGTRRTYTAEPGRTGFRRQLVAWAGSLRGDGSGGGVGGAGVGAGAGIGVGGGVEGGVGGGAALPGLREVRQDTLAVREAALRLT
ncbi:Gfo/Idh/MocA family protein [Streptomyces sp. NPDC087422]|uniref:Gfo/Idh/MocA family protein n=1 Tax=Streptomyces sp. NPDC087422 TaxID=3365786 RepID=UPI0037FFC980